MKPPSIDPLKNFSVAPLTAGKMSDIYAKSLAGAVTTPDANQRLMRQAGKLPAGLANGKLAASGLGAALTQIKGSHTTKAMGIKKGGM